MSSREEFEKWYIEIGLEGFYSETWAAWQARQPEIDALKADDGLQRLIGEHLAVVHRDGGHHSEEVDVPQSIADATQVVLADRKKILAMREEISTDDELRKAADEAHDFLLNVQNINKLSDYLKAMIGVRDNLRKALEKGK